MNHSTTAIRFRFSAAQMSVLWPGLDLITSLHKERNTKGGIRFEYPSSQLNRRPGTFYCGGSNRRAARR